MNENQFVVDLGSLRLTDDQKKKLNAAIQKAVAGELANIELEKEVVLIPVSKWPVGRGPMINGIIIEDIKNAQLEKLLKGDIQQLEE